MAVSDPVVEVEATAAVAPTMGPRRGPLGWLERRGLAAAIPTLVAGLVGIFTALDAFDADQPVVKYSLAVVAVIVLYLGLRLTTLAVLGPDVDLGLAMSLGWIVVVVLTALFADFLPLAESHDVSKVLTEPIRQRPDLLSDHPFGTDSQGLDILGGVIYGARISLTVGLGAVTIGVTVGTLIGMAAGYYRGKLEALVALLTDSMLAFPPLILLLGMVAVLAPSVRNVTLALAIIGIPTYVRLARANTLVFAQREFVLAARALGDRNRSIIMRELLPNVLLPVLSFSFLIVAVLIVAEASLSFLGLSVQRPTPTWGNMISAGQDRYGEHPHVVFIPGAVLFLTVYAFNRVGDRARELWDPREAKI